MSGGRRTGVLFFAVCSTFLLWQLCSLFRIKESVVEEQWPEVAAGLNTVAILRLSRPDNHFDSDHWFHGSVYCYAPCCFREPKHFVHLKLRSITFLGICKAQVDQEESDSALSFFLPRTKNSLVD
jgi:hypothetical protein